MMFIRRKMNVLLTLGLAVLNIGAFMLRARPVSAQQIKAGTLTYVDGHLTCDCTGEGSTCGCIFS